MYISVHHSNSNPLIIGTDYLKFLYEVRHLPHFIRLDRGTETTTLATMHSFIHDSSDYVIYGPSSSNKIERWWKELHERLELYFKRQLTCFLDSRLYNPHDLLNNNFRCLAVKAKRYLHHFKPSHLTSSAVENQISSIPLKTVKIDTKLTLEKFQNNLKACLYLHWIS